MPDMAQGTPQVSSFFDKATFTVTHIVADRSTSRAAIIDPVLDFDPKSGRTGTQSADLVIAHIAECKLTVDWILETHVHADHLTATPYLKQRLGGRTGIGSKVGEVQSTFKKVFHPEPEFATDGRQFDHLFADNETFRIGSLEGRAMHTPGHTPACVTYVVGDAAFVGDTLFMPDFGTARCDFPGGSAIALYRSIRRTLALPPETRLFMCHDYGPGGRPFAWETTVAEQRAKNIHVHDGIDEPAFVKMRTERDANLDMPQLILPSVQVNIRAGEMPPAEENGVVYLKLPVNTL